MSDDLKKRLRQHRYNTWNDDLGPEPDKALAADRIEQLEVNYIEACEEATECYVKQCIAERKLARAVEALQVLHHAVCGETGFAAAVRMESGKAYPWPALDNADDFASTVLAELKEVGS